jgi:hypothetical protein
MLLLVDGGPQRGVDAGHAGDAGPEQRAAEDQDGDRQ